jgi:hypothetical protein
MGSGGQLPETAYYYPEPYWLAREGGWIKSLLLFFDEVAILLPSYMQGRNVVADPTLAGPLEERGLLRVLQPEVFVDGEIATELTAVVEALIHEGAFDELSKAGGFAELSMSRMGFGVLDTVARRVLDQLSARGLAMPTEDGVSIPMHPRIRSIYLVLLAQLARQAGVRSGLDLHPVTNGRGATEAFEQLADLPPMPSRGSRVQARERRRASALHGEPADVRPGAEPARGGRPCPRPARPPSRAARASQRSTQTCSRSVEKPQGRHRLRAWPRGRRLVGGGSQPRSCGPGHPGCWSKNAAQRSRRQHLLLPLPRQTLDRIAGTAAGSGERIRWSFGSTPRRFQSPVLLHWWGRSGCRGDGSRSCPDEFWQ